MKMLEIVDNYFKDKPLWHNLTEVEAEELSDILEEATDADYWFLRKNGIDAKAALRILAIAYNVKERLEMEEEKLYNDFHKTGGGGERQ